LKKNVFLKKYHAPSLDTHHLQSSKLNPTLLANCKVIEISLLEITKWKKICVHFFPRCVQPQNRKFNLRDH
jgi:hypothetical protein